MSPPGDPAARSSSALRVTLVQLDIRDGEPGRNRRNALGLMDEAPSSDLYLLPELWTTGYAYDTWDDAADRDTPETIEALARWATARQATVGGSLITRAESGGLRNRFWLLGADGTRVFYDKVHLFPPLREPELLEPGPRHESVDLGGFRAGLSICFDLRFPEMYAHQAMAGADLFLVASEWPASRAGALDVLARARAVENQAYVVLCNRVGTAADGLEFGGGSMVVGPRGEALIEPFFDAGCRTCDLDPIAPANLRSELPVLELRRPTDRGADTPA